MSAKKKYLVDVFRYYARCVEVEASNPAEAEDIAYEKTQKGEFDPASFEMTDDIETTTCGYVGEDGEHHYN